MAIELIPNQLVKLYDTETFNQRNKRLTWDDRVFCQIVRDEQTTQFQVRLTSLTGANLVSNGDFEDNFTDWYILFNQWQIATGNVLQGEKIDTSNPSIYQTITVEANQQYKVTVDILQLLGSNSATVGFAASWGGDIVGSLDIDKATYGTTPGAASFYFNSGAYTSLLFAIGLEGEIGDLVYLDNIEVTKLSQPTVTLIDSGGTTVETLTPFAQALDVITYQVEWAGKDEGTYRVCISGVDDLDKNYLDNALALGTEGDEALTLEDGDLLYWYG